MITLEFSIKNGKFIIDKFKNDIVIYFYIKCNSIWYPSGQILLQVNNTFTIAAEYQFIDLLITSELFIYERIDEKYYIFELNNFIKLQLL